MNEISTTTLLHSRLCCFVDWIAPDPEKIQEIQERAEKCRKLIRQNAEKDGLIISSTPNAGSFAKKDGLRRHYSKNTEIDGMDVDIPIVVKPKTDEGEKLEELLNKFEKYTRQSYPDTRIERTESSVKLIFNDGVSFDIVPMLATEKDDEQILIKRDNSRIRTSVQKHVEFVKKRTQKSNEVPGRVKFNECVRLVKWWKEIQTDKSSILCWDENPDMDYSVRSILTELVCAYAFDKIGVSKTYAETLSKWFSFLANHIRNKSAVFFTDYYSTPTIENKYVWSVLDPVNSKNNIVRRKWTNIHVSELATWFEEGRDTWQRIIHYDDDGENNLCMEELIELFGTPFKSHCEKTK